MSKENLCSAQTIDVGQIYIDYIRLCVGVAEVWLLLLVNAASDV